MANHKSAKKRIRQTEAKKEQNKYHVKTARSFVKKLKASTEKSEAEELLKKVSSMLDKLAKKNLIHKKNAGNQKSKLTKHVAGLK